MSSAEATAFQDRDLKGSLSFSIMDIRPYGYDTAAGPAGVYVEIARHICIEIQRNCLIRITPYARAYSEVVTGQVDATIMFQNKELEQGATQIGSVGQLSLTILAKKSERSKLEGTGTLTIAKLRGGCQELSVLPHLKIIEVSSIELGIRMVDGGRVNGFCNEERALRLELARMGKEIDQKYFFFPVAAKKIFLHVRKNLPKELQQELKDAVVKLKPTYFH